MGTEKLSHILLDLGFFSALGTMEWVAGEDRTVRRGTPHTWDINNGVLVVYDEEGSPWITTDKGDVFLADAVKKYRVGENTLRRGAYVPHSNDGGHFMNEVLPTL